MKRFSLFTILFALLSGFMFFSCEVGLGEAVDTEAPKITIDYPESKAIVRDSFVLAGTCSDDIAVTKVIVSILDEKNKTVTGYDFNQPVVETTIDEKQFWSVPLNEKLQDGTYPLKDGKYTFRAVAYDGAGRKSGELERDLEIDNTAPVFIINSPGSISTESSFGSVFKIEGSIAENHTVKEMNLTIFDADGTKIAEWQQENINTAGGTTVTFAKYYSDSEKQDPLFDRYKEIYGDSSGFKSFSCSVKLMDNALTYKKPDFVPSYNDDSRGEIDTGTNYNTTTNLWLYDDIYGTDAKFKLMGNAAKAEWGKDFEIKDFMNYLNGTDSYEQKNSNGKSVVEVLNEAKINTEDTRLKFKLNKDANPTYTIMGYSFDSTAQTGGIYSLSPAAKGGTITFKADAGLDGVLFSPSTIKVYMFGPFEAIQVQTALTEIYSSPDNYASAPENKKITTKLYDGENGISGADKDVAGPYEGESKTTWTQSLNLPSDSSIMKATKYYIIAASGCDKDNVDMISLNYKYNGFIAQATGVPPTVTIKEPEKDSISNAENEILIFKGDVISEEGTAINDISYEISVYDTLEKNKFLGTIKNIDSAGNRSDSLKVNGTLGESPSVSFEIDAAKGFWQSADRISIDGTKPPLNSAYKYTLTVTGVTDTKGTDSISVTLDKKLPSAELEVSTLLSNEKDGKTRDNCVNGKIKIKGTLSDNDKIASAWAEISDSKGNVTKSNVQPEGTGSFTWDFDTTLLSDNTEYSVIVYALDRAGNKGSSSEQKIYVDLSTDLPVITLSNADKTFTGKPSLSSNLFGMGSNVLIGAVSDDDGIASIDYVIDEDKGENAVRGTIAMAGKTPTSKSFQIDIAQLVKDKQISSGDHTLSISATDISSGLTNVSTPVKSSEETGVSKMAFGYDDDVPSLSVTTKSGELIGKDISYSITGTASDGSAFTLYRYSIDPGRNKKDDGTPIYGSKEKPVEISVSTDGNWTDKIDTTDNGDEFEYYIIDEYGRSTTAKFTFKIDSVNPKITLTQPEDDTVYIGETKLYSFRGTADDPEYDGDRKVDSSGITGIEYTVYASNGTETEQKTAAASTQWNININFDDYKDAETSEIDVSKIEFRSVDGGGLKSEPVSCSVIIDKISPVITAVVKQGGTVVEAVQNTYYTKSAPEVEITVFDENLENVSASKGSLMEKTPSETNPVYTLSGVTEAGEYVISATDKSGRVSSYTLNMYVDVSEPSVEITSVSPVVENNSKKNVNGKITVTGTASDDDKVNSTILYVNDVAVTNADGTAISGRGVTVNSYQNSGMRVSYEIDTTAKDGEDKAIYSDKSDIKIALVSTDRAGNTSIASESNSKIYYVDQDTDKPVLKFSNGDVNITNENAIQIGTNLFGMGSNTLYINVSDDDGIQSVSLVVDGGTPDELLTDGKSTTWSTSKDVSKYGSGVHSLKFTITDTEGKTVSYPKNDSDTIKIAFDDDVPSVSVIKFNEVTYTEGCFTPAAFTLNGTVKDSSGTVKIYEEENLVATITNCTDITNWIHDISGEISGNDKTRTYVARDKYGRESSVTIKYNVDTIKPVFISNYISISGETSAGSQTYNLNSYNSSDIWFTNSLFTVKGESSGENKPVTEENNFTIQIKVGDDIVSTLQPGANNTFSGTMDVGTTAENPSKTITLTATDEAGNISSPLNFTVNVDKDPPKITTKDLYTENPTEKPGAQALTDNFVNKDKIYFKYIVSDAVSGVSKVEVYKTAAMKDSIGSFTVTSPSKGNVDGIIEIDISNFESKEYDFYVKVTDKAGNTTSSDLVNFTFDKTAPTVTYSKPTAGSDVNKTIIISGTYTEENKSQALNAELYYRKNGDSWIKASNEQASNLTVSEDGKWSVEFNTNYLDDNTKYDFQMRMVDMAGNQVKDTSDYLTLKVNQNSDRPVIKLNFDTNGNARLNSGTFSGNITDDDGNVSKLYFQAVSAKSDFSDTNAKWKELSVTNGSWEIPNENKLMDGTYFLYFKVVDAKKSSFVTGDTDGLTVPYIQYASNPAVYAPVSFSVDTQAPVISDVGATLGETEDATESYELVQNNKVFGGVSYRYAKFKIKASDTVSKADNLTVKVKIGDAEYPAVYNTGDKVYYTEKIDLSSMISGIYQLNVTATDQAQMAANWTRMVIVDNNAPSIIKNVTPSNLVEVTGDFDMTGLVQDDEEANSGIPVYDEAMWYYIPKYSEKNTAEADLDSLDWTTDNFSRSSVAWTLKLGDLAKTIGYDASSESVSDDYKNYEVSGNSALYDIPVWFKIKDNAGNIGYNRENFIHYNPNADKPTVTFIYPGDAEKENGKILMGGVARFQGSANDNEGIEGVYLQFDMNGDGIWENGEGINGIYRNDSGNVYVGDKENVAVNIPVVGGMGFKAKGTLTWTSSIDLTNVSLEEGKTFNVRAIAIDSDVEPLSSAWSNVVEITINNDIPQFGKFYLVQYTDETYSTIKQQIDYNEDVYISGSNWRFEGNATHKDGIKSIVVVGSDKDYSNNGDFAIPVTPNDKGQWSVTIIATDNGLPSHPRSQNISVNVDNTAPVFGGKNGVIEIFRDAYGVEANKLGNNVYIQNSNGGFASLSSRAVESGSGFACAVFYFKRTGSENRIYNVMESSSNKTVLESAKADGKVYVNSEGIPVLYKSTVSRSSTTSIELTTNNNIRVGGLVKIGGSYHKIVGVDATSVTLADEVDTKFNEDVEFVYGMVVDNSGESRKIDGTLKDDDGDGMVESYSKSSSNYTWDVEVPSANIPDGPIEVHVVLFDKAGNTNHKFVTTRISNNAPRIARVRLATDLNGNSTYEENEKQVFAYLETDTLDWAENTKSKGTEIWNLDGKVNGTVWTIKNTLQVEPEFVGGTAPFHYIFTKESGIEEGKNLSSPKTGSATGQINGNKEAFVIPNSSLDTSEDKINTYQFSFWDSTEETTPCTDSQWTVLNVQLKQDVIDNFAPKVVVKPFFWNSASDNSLYENSLDNGHIELEGDLDFENNPFTNADGEYDKDPKVSGKIVFRGTAYDDVRLSSLWIKFTDFTFSNYVPEAGYGTDGTSDGYVQAAFYDNANNVWKVPAAKLDDDGWTFEAENEYFDQKGHKVNWTLTIDTSKIAEVAETDVVFAAMAVDHGKLASSEDNSNAVTESGETDTSDKIYNKPKYRVDVVPYITGLDTVLTDLEVLNPSVYGRSALGKYPVYYYRKTTSGGTNAEKIILKGFNISGGTVTFNGAATGTIDGSNAISIPGTAKSGEISISVHEISSLNNKNADVEYNRQPNGQNNNILTDNVELAIWEINSKAAISKTGELSEVVMHVNPANGMLGFAFAHSQDLASYPNGTTSSYQTWITDWTGVNQIGFIYDQKGNMYGTNGGTDTYTPSKKTGRFGLISSLWGTIATDSASNDASSGYTGNKRLRLEYLGYWGNNPSYASNVNRFAKGDCSQFATTDNGDYTNLYIIYYDNTLGELKFRAGSYDTITNPVPNGGCFSKGSVSFGDFADDAWQEKCSDRDNYNPNYKHISIISNVKSGANGNSNAKPGTYYSIAAIKGGASDGSDVVSVVWYDETNKSLWYSYIENPLNKDGERDEYGAVSTEWATPVPLLKGNAGESCAIATDEDGHIHIAAYSRSNAGSLYYIYLDKYNSSFNSSKNLVKIDSYGSTGQYITMEVAKDSNGNNIPYIGYWMNSMSYPKYTYLVDTSSSEEGEEETVYYPKAGVDDLNLYTGAWESIMLPTSSSILLDDINIGLYRYLADENGHKKGEIREIPTRTESAGGVTGIAGGNGTSNPIIAYGITETGAGYVETAQLK